MTNTVQHVKACSDCPFRRGSAAKLRRGRCEELRYELESDGHFHCHKTVDYSCEDGLKTDQATFCVGSLQVFGFGQLPRIAGRMGMIPPDIVTDDEDVHDNPDEWIEDCGVM